MPPPSVLWDEDAAHDALRSFLVAICPEVQAVNIYRARPLATPGAAQGPSVIIDALTPAPEYLSPHGSESDSPQAQRWLVTVATAAAGPWSVTLLGQTTAPVVAVLGDTPVDIAAALRSAVDVLAIAVTTAPGPSPAAFYITGNVAGASLGVSVSAPAGGAAALAVVDDNVRRCVFNWGIWRVRLLFRDTPSSQAVASRLPRSLAAPLAERVRCSLQASSLPVINGVAFPYWRDQLRAAGLVWQRTASPLQVDIVESGLWVRTVVLEIEFQARVGMLHDVPSLDAIGLAGAPVLADS